MCQPPTGYDYDCVSNVPFDGTGSATAYYNDPDGDCWSNDWEVHFVDSEGVGSVYTDQDWNESNPDQGGWYDFDTEFWDCCNDEITGGGSNGDNDDSGCPCTWDWDPAQAILTVECPC